MKKRKPTGNLHRVPCKCCNETYAKVCLHDGGCGDCSAAGRAQTHGITKRDYNTLKIN